MAFAHPTDSVQQLQSKITGSVLLPGDTDYEQTRRGFNLAIDQHPALILIADGTQDIIAGVRFAAEHNLGISVQLTGHGIQYPADESLLIVTSRMASLHIDAKARTARIGAGARFQDVLDKSVEHGLAPLLGTSPHVGVVGYTLGGGIGWLARRYGFAADSVRWIDIVTADGTLRHTSSAENAELFWGLRGGGGNFGVVTEMEFDLYPVTTLYGGALTYPAEQAAQALRFFREWTKGVPDELTASIAVVKFPPIPQVPEALRGKCQVIVKAAYLGDGVGGAPLIQPWLDWQKPLNNTFHQMPFGEVGSIQNDPVDPAASYATSETIDELSDAAIDVLVRYATASESPILYSELRHARGAMARTDPNTSAVGNRNATYYFVAGGLTPTPQAARAVEDYARRYKEALHPYVQGGAYLNFMRGAEVRYRTRDAFEPAAFERLVALKAKYDPADLFRFSYQLVNPA